MDFFFSKIFWGLIVIIFGLSIILNAVFKIDFPFFRVLISIVIIYFGIRLLMGSFGMSSTSKSESTSIFSETNHKIEQMDEVQREYSTVFGKQTIDLSDLSIDQEARVEFNAVFGSQYIILPRKGNYKLKASAVFGSAMLPNEHQVAFGDGTYNSEGEGPTLFIEGNVVFGQLRFIRN